MSAPAAHEIEKTKKTNWRWIAGAVLLLLIAYATRSGFVVYFLYAVILVMLASRLIVEICVRGLECKRELSRFEITIGEQVEVMLTVRNTGMLPIPWVLLEDLVPDGMPVKGERARLLTLMPGREEQLFYQVVLNRRGYHQFGPFLAETGDLFGFFRRYKTGRTREYVTVFPAVEQLTEYDIASRRPLGTVKISNKIFEDPTRIIGVREYEPGDPLNRIHWKTTARMGELHSKVFEPSKVIGATVILDFHKDGYRGPGGEERGELAVLTAASITDYIASAREQVGFLTNGRDQADTARWEMLPLLGKIRERVVNRARASEESDRLAPFMVPTRKTVEQGRLILEALARVDYTDGFTIGQTLRHSFQYLNRDSVILVITPRVTEDMAITLSIMKETGYSVNLFIIADEPGYFEAVELLAPRSIDIFHIANRESVSKYATHDIYY